MTREAAVPALLEQLAAEDRSRVAARLRIRDLARGEVLTEAGTPAQSLFFTRHGQFRAGETFYGPGRMIDAEAFFSRGIHPDTVIATRTAQVFELDRPSHDALLAEVPGLAPALLEGFAGQVRTAGAPQARRPSVLVVPLCALGQRVAFLSALRNRMASTETRLLEVPQDDATDIPSFLGARAAEGRQVAFLADDPGYRRLQSWMDHADEVIIVTEGRAAELRDEAVLRQLLAAFPSEQRRLVRLHPERQGVVSGTAEWLAKIPAAMHHHVCLKDNDDVDALLRFITGRAVGLVGGGGGGLGAAYSGICRALGEEGISFDYLLGTSVGSSMLAGLAYLGDHRTLSEGTEYIFVRQRSFKKFTLPRHSLLDHKTFDRAMQDTYGAATRIEDCWKPYAAIATNVSARRTEVIRTGPLWQAVRASTAVPCVLPPFVTDDGMMLIDGSIMNDAPVDVMRQIKAGPNVVVHFGRPGVRRMKIDYDELPGRAGVLRSFLPVRRRRRSAPGILSMLYRTMMVHQTYDIRPEPGDLVLNPPSFPGASMVNFDNHKKVTAEAYDWTLKELATRHATGQDSALLRAGRAA
ncbi:patatin-like phospholipase family protein [Salipiger mucosus]|uniref:Uncharacterized protein n=1 Tax=Salipiger mucosus DSM 16094 TaxID=1123237 RepID=S9S152_9RHOB|nr:cyclic nucleotide-binding and patatin-like phospholipase domain-containing protein [Salipiger mucosus]EPX83950.1 hypothetical protein Salmuc_01725 [Salipiger mucosus DSM 16094]